MSSKNVILDFTNLVETSPITSKDQQQNFTPPETPHDDPLVENITQLITNSVVLNKKLHRQILEKEYIMKTQNHEVSHKMTNLFRQMQDLYHKTQSFYQETVRQNQKARFLAEELIKPFREQLRSKVDQTTLSLKMKLLLTEFDNLGHKISYDKEGKVKQEAPSTLQFIKKELFPLIASLQSRIHILETNDEDQQKKIDQIFLKQNEIQSKIFIANIQISQLKKNSISLKQKQQSLRQQLTGAFKKLNETLIKNSQELSGKIQLIKKDANEVKLNLQKQTFLSKANEKNQKHSHEKSIEEVKQTILESLSEVKKQLQQVKVQASKHIQELVAAKSTQKELKQSQIKDVIQENKKIRESFAQFSNKIQEQALNNINKAIIAKLHKLQADHKNSQTLLKNHQMKINVQQRELISIKNLLAQKANFSDFVRIIQMKADKEDCKYLKDLIHLQNQSFAGLKQPNHEHSSLIIEQNTSFNNFKLRNKRSLVPKRKKLSNSPSPMRSSIENQDSMKKYMLGFDSPAQRKSIDKSKLMFSTQGDRIKWLKARKDSFQFDQKDN